MTWLDSIHPSFDLLSHLGALAFAYILALAVAWDRERNERSAGLRAFPFVAIAACGFIQAAEGSRTAVPKRPPASWRDSTTGSAVSAEASFCSAKSARRELPQLPASGPQGLMGKAVGLGAYDTAIVLSIVIFATLRIMTKFKTEGAQGQTDNDG